MRKIISLALAISLAFSANAAEPSLDLLKNLLKDGSEIKGVQPAPIAGFYEVEIDGGVVYLSADGTHVFSGDLYNLKGDYSYTERKMNTVRTSSIKDVRDSDKIIYKASNEKYKVSVFTDIDCGYCTKLHAQMSAYNKKGITIEYLAFPRQGLESKNAKNMQNIWCSKSKTKNLTAAKMNRKVPSESCKGTQVAEQFALGQKLGVYATPTIVLSDGELLPGYITPEKLLETLTNK